MKKNLIKILFVFFFSFFGVHLYSQNVGIGTTAPTGSAILEILSANKGLLIPRIQLISITDVATIPSPASFLLVFNTNSSLSAGQGLYYWNSLTSASKYPR